MTVLVVLLVCVSATYLWAQAMRRLVIAFEVDLRATLVYLGLAEYPPVAPPRPPRSRPAAA